MSTSAVVALLFFAPFGLYIAARLIFAAWFFTARQFKERDHG